MKFMQDIRPKEIKNRKEEVKKLSAVTGKPLPIQRRRAQQAWRIDEWNDLHVYLVNKYHKVSDNCFSTNKGKVLHPIHHVLRAIVIGVSKALLFYDF